MDFQQHTQPETSNEPSSGQNQQLPEVPAPNPTLNQENVPTPQQSAAQMPSGNGQPSYGNDRDSKIPYQYQPPYGIDGKSPYQNRQDGQNAYGNGGGQPFQNRQDGQNAYGNANRHPYQNNMPNPYGNQYNNGNNPNNNPYGYQNNYPYYNRSAYQLHTAEPGSSLASAAMVLGIISIVSCFTFTVYPAFIVGSIAILLALLSKGSRPHLFPKAKTGIICAAAGLIANTILVTSVMLLLFTNSDFRDEVNQTFEKQYGVTFDEMIDEILEENGY